MARISEPNSQNTSVCNWSGSATYSAKASKALKMKCSAMPSSVTVSTPMPERRASTLTMITVSRLKAKALAATNRSGGSQAAAPVTEAWNTIASAAPKPAAEEMPRVNGSANWLFNTVCINDPDSASEMPVSAATKVTGARISHSTTRTRRIDRGG